MLIKKSIHAFTKNSLKEKYVIEENMEISS